MRERDRVFFVLASVRIRKWVCLSFFTEDETHTNLMLLGVVAWRKIKANPTIALVRAQRLTLPAPISSTNACNPPLKPGALYCCCSGCHSTGVCTDWLPNVWMQSWVGYFASDRVKAPLLPITSYTRMRWVQGSSGNHSVSLPGGSWALRSL